MKSAGSLIVRTTYCLYNCINTGNRAKALASAFLAMKVLLVKKKIHPNTANNFQFCHSKNGPPRSKYFETPLVSPGPNTS